MSFNRQKAHSHGSGCRLAPLSYPTETDPELDGIPPLVAQFFYSSVIPIDDPLALAAAPDTKSSKPNPPRPFSQGDNNALEAAWLSLASEGDRRDHCHALKSRSRSPSPSSVRGDHKKMDALCRHLLRKHTDKHMKEGLAPSTSAALGETPICCAELRIDASNELRRAFCALVRRHRKGLDEDTMIQAVMSELEKSLPLSETVKHPNRAKSASVSSALPITIGSIPSILNMEPGSAASSLPATRIGRTERRTKGDHDSDSRRSSISRVNVLSPGKPKAAVAAPRPPALDDGIVGKPFVRAGAPGTPAGLSSPGLSLLLKGSGTVSKPPSRDEKVLSGADKTSQPEELPDVSNQDSEASFPPEGDHRSWELRGQPVEVPVGVSRLHMVSLPVLQMKPIYWSPVNDISIVLRATWFYRDTMTPVEPRVANQLELGYRELQPWTEAWGEEIRCAIDVGALGEEKVVQPLWPQPVQNKHHKPHEDDVSSSEPSISDDPHCAARCFRGEAAAEGTLEAVRMPDPTSQKSHANYHVLYKNSREAFLLKSSLKPSAYYGRRPVSKIMKGTDVGTPVVRGFDRDLWSRLHERAKSKAAVTEGRSDMALSQGPAQQSVPGVTCLACQADIDRWRVNDLVLVAHGIGQKFAERVESFHFTHAINAFRRAMNVELGNEQLRQAMGNGTGSKNGIMVLPVNWRHKLSFEDGGPIQDDARASPGPEGFGLKDIEPKTIPAVRSMISDIMFDIPFYMSHHKPKMVHALVGEANRVYRLWCGNNPGFAEKGRVHLIAHSLGSVMALEVLSNQPTKTPPLNDLDLDNSRHFAFDTVNLFLLGSPAGFFLLLERGQLMPRRGRLKPGADPTDATANDVVAEQGQFGCLAVNNIYNILAREDPIAYLLNGTIDPVYAAGLKTAYVPTTNVGMFQSIGNGIKGLWGGGASNSHQQAGAAVAPVRPSPNMRLPSQLELEVHDFTREEIAERKAYLLNDNGQIDYYLRSGGGPLEIQYLNMLSAHSSYWTSIDLVRMLCMEIGRKSGRSNTYPVMRAQKTIKRMVPSVS